MKENTPDDAEFVPNEELFSSDSEFEVEEFNERQKMF